jgi:hypothetical protein
MNGDDEDPYSVIPSTAVTTITQVHVYDSAVQHALDGHPEIGAFDIGPRAVIEQAVANPSTIYDSRTDPGGSVVFVSTVNTYEGNPLYVPIRIVSGTSARVTTAYFSSTTASGPVLWSKGND